MKHLLFMSVLVGMAVSLCSCGDGSRGTPTNGAPSVNDTASKQASRGKATTSSETPAGSKRSEKSEQRGEGSAWDTAIAKAEAKYSEKSKQQSEKRYREETPAEWVALLSEPGPADSPGRRDALDALSSIGIPAAPVAAEAMESKNPDARRVALWILQNIGLKSHDGAVAALPGLVRALQDKNSDIRMRANKHLRNVMDATFGRVATVPPVCEDASVVSALTEVSKEAGSDEEADESRLIAIEALALCGKAAVPALSEVVANGDCGKSRPRANRFEFADRLRRQAAQALQRLGPDAIGAVSTLLEAARKDAPENQAARAALSKIGSAALPSLVEALRDTRLRDAAIQIMGSMKSAAREALPALIKAYQDGSGIDSRAHITRALESIGPDAQCVPVLIDGLSHEDVSVRQSAIRSLDSVATAAEPAIPALIKIIRVGENESDEAARLLARIGVAAVPSLVHVLGTGDDKARCKAALALELIGPAAREQSMPALISAFSQSESWVQNQIVSAICSIGADERAVPVFIQALESNATGFQWDTQLAAIRALKDLGPKASAAIPTLKKIERQEYGNPHAKADAADALEAIQVDK